MPAAWPGAARSHCGYDSVSARCLRVERFLFLRRLVSSLCCFCFLLRPFWLRLRLRLRRCLWFLSLRLRPCLPRWMRRMLRSMFRCALLVVPDEAARAGLSSIAADASAGGRCCVLLAHRHGGASALLPTRLVAAVEAPARALSWYWIGLCQEECAVRAR